MEHKTVVTIAVLIAIVASVLISVIGWNVYVSNGRTADFKSDCIQFGGSPIIVGSTLTCLRVTIP